MVDLEKPSPFCYAKAWEKKDALNNPVPDEQQGFRQPDTSDVQRMVPRGEREHIAKVVPNSAWYGIERAMQKTLPQFPDKIILAWNIREAANNGTSGFTY